MYVAGEAKRRERGGTGGGADSQTICAPFLAFARVFTRALPVVYLCGSRIVVWVAAAIEWAVGRVMVAQFAREVLTTCSRARIVECNL